MGPTTRGAIPAWPRDIEQASGRIYRQRLASAMTVDDRLVSDVSVALANDPGLRGAYLNVDSLNGEVRVSGTVQDYAQAALVRRVAEGVAGPGRVMTSLAPR